MHSRSTSPPRERLACDAAITGLTLHELRSYYDSLPPEAAAAVLATLIASLRHIQGHAQELEELIASAKRIGKVRADEGREQPSLPPETLREEVFSSPAIIHAAC